MSELTSFEKRYLNFEAKSADEVADWISNQHASIRITPCEEVADGTVARLSRATIDDVALVLYRYNLALKGEFSADYDAYFICLPISGSSKRICPHNGAIVQNPDQVLIYRRMEGLENTNSSDYTNLSLVVPASLLENQLQSLMVSQMNARLSFTPLVNANSGPGRAVVSLINYLMSQFNNLPDPFSHPISNANFKSYLNTVLLSSLPHNYSHLLNSNRPNAVPRSVKRAEEYMRELCAGPITIEQLAGAAGCSPRALHVAFKTFRGTTPMAVLCDFRLEAAHNEIIKEMGTVTDIAGKYGFSNAGRFAKQYAQKFGQKPSQTRLIGATAYPISTNTQPASSFTG
ncbi:MAG: AraC family transcriptional regulator [Alphaproteobacteria bacterium]|nr:AraC family transcriptional regulator [Alphaproteobacteria bacterium]